MVLDGQEGLEALAQRRPDLILSDAVMPRMDGFEFCRQAKLDPALSDIPFMLLTSLSQNLRDRSLAVGADDYLHKQVSDLIFRMRIRLNLAIGLRGGILPETLVLANAHSILVVSPAKMIQAQLHTNLSKDGLDVQSVAGLGDVLPHLKAQGGDLVILDLDYPEGDLEEFIDTLRIHPVFGHVPVLALATKEEDDRLALFEREVQDRLLKPLDGLDSRHRVKLLLRLAVPLLKA
jgi:CheY-like chemotaxis protein